MTNIDIVERLRKLSMQVDYFMGRTIQEGAWEIERLTREVQRLGRLLDEYGVE